MHGSLSNANAGVETVYHAAAAAAALNCGMAFALWFMIMNIVLIV